MNQSNKNFKIYRASAGSGKTYTIALKYIAELMKNPLFGHTQILAVTFTNDAAGEMKERILDELYGLILTDDKKNDEQKKFLANLQKEVNKGIDIRKNAIIAYEAILNDYSNFNITTIDSFFQKVLRNMAKELGISSQFEIEMDTTLPIKDAVRAVIDKSAKDTGIQDKIFRFVEHKLENEKWNIQRDLESFSGNIFKEIFQKQEKNLLGQTNRIKKSIEICKKIKKELEEPIKNCIYDYDNLCREQNINDNSFYYKEKGGCPSFFNNLKKDFAFETGERTKQILNRDEKMPIFKPSKKELDEMFFNLLQKAEENREKLFENIEKYNSACLFLKYIHSLLLLEDIANEIQVQNDEKNRFMLAKTNQLLHEIIDDSDMPFIYEKIGANIKSIIIDEFQDTSTLQWENFKPLLDKNNFGMLVGDVKQSIYRWRNGNWKILNEIDSDKDFAFNSEITSLEKNWRSAENIVKFNNVLFKKISKIFGKSDKNNAIYKAYKDVRQVHDFNKKGFVSVDFVPAGKKWNTYETADGENTMINAIAEKIEILLNSKVKQGDICILCRSKKDIRKIAEKLPKKINVNIISEEAFRFESSRELSVIISALKILSAPDNPVYKAELMIKLGEISKNKLNLNDVNNLSDKYLKDVDKNLPLYELIIKLCSIFEFNENSDSRFLFAFMEKILDFTSKNTSDISTFLEYWDEKLKDEAIPMPTKKGDKRDGILVMTIHKSKGLEFHSTIVPFVDWDLSDDTKGELLWCSKKEEPFDAALYPIEYSKKTKQSAFKKEYDDETLAQNMDNLNVLYVALTRAAKNLFILAKEKNSEISKIISDIVKSTAHFQVGTIVKSEKEKNTGKNEPNYISFNMHENEQEIRKNDENEKKNEGKIIHKIFEYIEVLSDVENAVKRVISLGEIQQTEEENYVKKVKNYIKKLDKDWFLGKYKIFNEREILGNLETFRPDRVLVDERENAAIIIDYKKAKKTYGFHGKNENQVKNYKKKLQDMGYKKVSGFLWYLSNNEIVEVKGE